jgi:hypothetical protein
MSARPAILGGPVAKMLPRPSPDAARRTGNSHSNSEPFPSSHFGAEERDYGCPGELPGSPGGSSGARAGFAMS